MPFRRRQDDVLSQLGKWKDEDGASVGLQLFSIILRSDLDSLPFVIFLLFELSWWCELWGKLQSNFNVKAFITHLSRLKLTHSSLTFTHILIKRIEWMACLVLRKKMCKRYFDLREVSVYFSDKEKRWKWIGCSRNVETGEMLKVWSNFLLLDSGWPRLNIMYMSNRNIYIFQSELNKKQEKVGRNNFNMKLFFLGQNK